MFMTICIPTFNRAYILGRAIESVISQTDPDWELLIVDDGSSDETCEIVEKYLSDRRIFYLKKENGGKHSALNEGIKNAKGEYFLILDSDDFLSENCVGRMKEILLNTSLECICGVIGKCANVAMNFSVTGSLFDTNRGRISYIDMHYRNSKHYGDCCECIQTKILKEYSWPEISGLKFVPESYVMDKIGVNYSLICVNEIFKYFEYLDDGITKNSRDFQKQNNLGFLINYVDKIDYIFEQVHIPVLKKLSIWNLYWNAVSIDCSANEGKGPRVKKISFLGIGVKILLPVINRLRKLG